MPLYCFLFPLFVFSQSENHSAKDTLTHLSFDYLQEKLDDAGIETTAFAYNNAIIQKAKKLNNAKYLAQGYKNKLHLEKAYPVRLQYADSIVQATSTLGKKDLASALLTKGAVYYSARKHVPALDCYLQAENLLSNEIDDPLYLKTIYCIAQVKYYLGYYSQAVSLLKPQLVKFKKNVPRGYLNTLHLLGLCYNRLGEYERCTTINRQGIAEAAKQEESEMLPYFLHSEGVNLYFKKNYVTAIKHLQSTFSFLESMNDQYNIAVAHYYIGRIRMVMGQEDEALESYQEVAKIFDHTHYLRPDLLPAFHQLIADSKKRGNLKEQLRYTNTLLYADSTLHADYKYLSGRLSNEFDSKELRREKARLEKALADSGNSKTFWILPLAFTLGIGFYMGWLIFKRRKTKSKDEEQRPEMIKNTPPSIKEEVVVILLERLTKFESEKKYLGKDMNLARMAKLLDTNTKYVSILIHEYRGKKTPDYLNDLKIDHLVHVLATDKKARNYTHKALAGDIGYSTTISLHKAFFNRMGVSFTEYMDALHQEDPIIGYQQIHTNSSNAHPGTAS
ncbi:hypothetical protein AMR72_15385 [Flavobacterium psychrophilum]|nr:hypothetical protein AMR72_15385 [Flavobacterium psychrophilum]AOE53774.1 hypothetical protein ALW18_15375 [Flavobacterium psychrophilum]